LQTAVLGKEMMHMIKPSTVNAYAHVGGLTEVGIMLPPTETIYGIMITVKSAPVVFTAR